METLGSTISGESGPANDGRRSTLSTALFADRPLEAGARYLLDVDEVLVARGDPSVRRDTSGKTARLVLRLDDPRMSSEHARLVRDGDAWSVVDLGSKNGTRVDGQPVERAWLTDGSVIEAGSTFFVFRAADASARDSTPTQGDGPSGVLGIPTLHGALEAAIEQLAKVARSPIAVVLLGASGTGKEVFARAIHAASGRSGPFQAINCGALPHDLVEAELFGCKKGAFSGATADREGLVRSAHGGTLLLDEIGDLPPPSQAALLRVLQEREVLPVGATRAVPVDVRILAATHRDLRGLVASGAFREDLLARLSGFELHLPPLAQRLEDVGLLVRDLLLRLAPDRARRVTFTRRAARALFAHAWPLNVRELEKCLERALVLAGDAPIDVDHFPEGVRPAGPKAGSPPPAEPPAVSPADSAQRAEIVRLLQLHRGNLSAVARDLGKARFQVQRWIKRFALRPGDYR